jgi:hypothetical protein
MNKKLMQRNGKDILAIVKTVQFRHETPLIIILPIMISDCDIFLGRGVRSYIAQPANPVESAEILDRIP